MTQIRELRKSGHTTNVEMANQVRRFLTTNRGGLQRVVVRAKDGEVEISGSVSSFFLRQMALALAKRVAGVNKVVDDLEVYLSVNSFDRKGEP
jgi:osmotically-inducible protein OsmY